MKGMPAVTYLSLGSNLGDRESHLEEAIVRLGKKSGKVERVSGMYESEPWGYRSEQTFVNCCLELHTRMSPGELLEAILEIERKMGRERKGAGYQDRIIDIDILLYGARVIDQKELKIPHPHMGERRFVLVPLAEIAPRAVHPLTGLPVREMLEQCRDPHGVSRRSSPRLRN